MLAKVVRPSWRVSRRAGGYSVVRAVKRSAFWRMRHAPRRCSAASGSHEVVANRICEHRNMLVAFTWNRRLTRTSWF